MVHPCFRQISSLALVNLWLITLGTPSISEGVSDGLCVAAG